MPKKVRRVCIPLFGIQTRLLPSGTARAGFTIYTAFTVCGGGYYLVLSSSAGKVVSVVFFARKGNKSLAKNQMNTREIADFANSEREIADFATLCTKTQSSAPNLR